MLFICTWVDEVMICELFPFFVWDNSLEKNMNVCLVPLQGGHAAGQPPSGGRVELRGGRGRAVQTGAQLRSQLLGLDRPVQGLGLVPRLGCR